MQIETEMERDREGSFIGEIFCVGLLIERDREGSFIGEIFCVGLLIESLEHFNTSCTCTPRMPYPHTHTHIKKEPPCSQLFLCRDED